MSTQRPPIPTPRAHLLNAYSNKETNEYEIINDDYNAQEPSIMNELKRQNIENVVTARNLLSLRSELGSRPYHEVDFCSNIGALSGSIKKIDDPSQIEDTKYKNRSVRKCNLTNFLSFWKNNRRKKPKNQDFLENYEIKNITFDGIFERESQRKIYDLPPSYEEAIKNSTPHSLKEYRSRWHPMSNNSKNLKCENLLRNDFSEEQSQETYENFDKDINLCGDLKSVPEKKDVGEKSTIIASQIFSTGLHLDWISQMCSYFDHDFKDFDDDYENVEVNREFFC